MAKARDERVPPIDFDWDGESMTPRVPRLADQHFAVGETYALSPYADRSTVSHNHEFAWLHTAWQNLPEDLTELYPSSEHLRKRALISAGYYNEQIIDAGTNAAALRVATAIRSREEFSLVIVRGPAVVIREAQSQSKRMMGKDAFQLSKTAIMEVVAGILGVTADDLMSPTNVAA
jgi:hypothetical protein